MHRFKLRSSDRLRTLRPGRTGVALWALCLLGACGQVEEAPPATESGTQAQPESLPALESVEVAGVQLEPRSMVDDRVSLLMPEGLALMDSEALAFKYPSDRRPTDVYTDESGGLNVIVNHTAEAMTIAGLDQARQFTEQMFGRMDPTAEWVVSEMRSVQGRDWFYLDFRSTASGVPIRNMMSATSLGGTMLAVTVNMTGDLEAAWAEPAEAILASLQVRGE